MKKFLAVLAFAGLSMTSPAAILFAKFSLITLILVMTITNY